MVLSNVLQDTQNVSDSEEFHQALVVLCKLLAPMAPHISSELWEGECGGPSVGDSYCNSPSEYSTSLSPKQEHFVFFGGGGVHCDHVFTVKQFCYEDMLSFQKC